MRELIAIGAVVCAVGFGSAPAAGQGALLYDIDFSEPFHTFGANVSLDTGATPREGFSGYFLTDPADEAVVDGVFDLRAMTDGVAVFNEFAQAELEIEGGSNPIPGADYDVYTLEFDAMILEEGSITVFFDAPAINRIRLGTVYPLDGTGAVTYGSSGTSPHLAGFTLGEFLAVRMTLDTVNQMWRIEVDGEVLYEGPVQNAVGQVRTVRFSAANAAFLDNVTLHGSSLDECAADLNDDGLLDLSDVTTFVESFLSGCD